MLKAERNVCFHLKSREESVSAGNNMAKTAAIRCRAKSAVVEKNPFAPLEIQI